MIRYRIGLINDFDNSHSFVDFRDYGALQTWDASRSSSPHRGYQTSTDTIAVFLNFMKVLETTDKAAARAALAGLIELAPSDLSDYLAALEIT